MDMSYNGFDKLEKGSTNFTSTHSRDQRMVSHTTPLTTHP